jgi:hypothetical protein
MERIVLEVDDTVGKIYSNLTEEGKQELNRTISLLLKKAANDASFESYMKLLDRIGTNAIARGLTPEILENLLASDD